MESKKYYIEMISRYLWDTVNSYCEIVYNLVISPVFSGIIEIEMTLYLSLLESTMEVKIEIVE